MVENRWEEAFDLEMPGKWESQKKTTIAREYGRETSRWIPATARRNRRLRIALLGVEIDLCLG